VNKENLRKVQFMSYRFWSSLSRGVDYTVKKVINFPVPAGMSLTNSPLSGIIKVFLARKSLVSDIPTGDGKIVLKYPVPH
jgi:hypothetical protein